MGTQDNKEFKKKEQKEEGYNDRTIPVQDPIERTRMSDVTAEGSTSEGPAPKLKSSLPPEGVVLGASTMKSITRGSEHDHLEHDVSQRRFGFTKKPLTALRDRSEAELGNRDLPKLQNLFKDIANPEFFFAETGEDRRHILYNGQITNQSVLDDNEQYFLRNIGAAKLN
ncbi:MAG: hypothetical protein JW682_07640 [Campylobacterales bacterium]|nr:hypothetical protein [Campylobacterales bacterium]HEO97890.1 hypothetical protein [Campylobacterota bacterium]